MIKKWLTVSIGCHNDRLMLFYQDFLTKQTPGMVIKEISHPIKPNCLVRCPGPVSLEVP